MLPPLNHVCTNGDLLLLLVEKNYVDLELTNLITLTVLTGSGTEAAHSAWVTIPHCLPEALNDERFPNKSSVLGSHSLPEEARVGGK